MFLFWWGGWGYVFLWIILVFWMCFWWNLFLSWLDQNFLKWCLWNRSCWFTVWLEFLSFRRASPLLFTLIFLTKLITGFSSISNRIKVKNNSLLYPERGQKWKIMSFPHQTHSRQSYLKKIQVDIVINNIFSV